MRGWYRIGAGIVLGWASWAGSAWAQAEDEYQRIELHVVAVSGEGLYLDGGRVLGLAEGDRVEIYPLGGEKLEGKLTSVAGASARLLLDDPGESGVDAGARAIVLLPRERLAAMARAAAVAREARAARERAAAQQGAQAAPDQPQGSAGGPQQGLEHPPWQQPVVEWTEDTPLLAPAARIEPEEREREWRGRVRVGCDWIDDREEPGRTYTSARTSLDLEVDNPFGRGGRFQLETDLYQRSVSIEGQEDDDETRLRLERLSYAWGGVRERPRRYEVGRFLSNEFPELGLIDGFEYVQRFESGSRAGFNAGLLPKWDDELGTGDDLEGSLFYRWVDSPDEGLALGAAAQKTWHKGESDRDLLLLTGDWRPGRRSFVHTSAWIDWYGSEDTAKGSGPELTRLFASANTMLGERTGAGIFFTHFRFPELIDDYDPAIAADLALERTSRLSLSLWHNLTQKLRLDGRADYWEDREDSGGGGELRVTARELLWKEGDVSLAVYDTDGRFSSGIGARLSASRRFGVNSLRLELERTDYEQKDVFGENAQLVHDSVRGSWDTRLGEMNLSLYAEERFGDAQSSTALGFVLSRRF